MSDRYYIYQHTSTVTGKSYIGYTNWEVHKRWLRHVELATGGSPTHFHNAIRKYGTDAWEHKTLLVVGTAEEAKDYERKIIELFDTYNSGYNSTHGGDGSAGYKWTEEQLQKKPNFAGENNPFYGKQHDPETMERIKTKLNQKRAEGWCPRKGKKHSEESLKKISENRKGKNPWLIQKHPLLQMYVAIHPDGTEEIVEGLSEFAKKHNLSRGNCSNVVVGRVSHTKGYKFRRYEPEKS